MHAGSLRHRVTLQTFPATRDAYGQAVAGSPTTFATVWAQVEDLRGREYAAGGEIRADLDARIYMRYMSGVLPTMTATYNGITFDILYVSDPEGRKRVLELLCKVRVE